MSDPMKRMIGQMTRRQLKTGAGEQDDAAMILLGERIIQEAQATFADAEEQLAKHVHGQKVPFPEWEQHVGYVEEGEEHAIFVSPLWTTSRECAVWVFASQLEKLGATGKITMKEARAHFLMRCGERLRLTHEKQASYDLASNRIEWNLHISQLNDQQAKGILWWDDPDQQASKGKDQAVLLSRTIHAWGGDLSGSSPRVHVK